LCNRTADAASDSIRRVEKEVAALASQIESLKTTHDAAIASLHMTTKSLEEQSLIAKEHTSKSLQVMSVRFSVFMLL
jgi:predicted  nucleic acid-binding Zn-ribbon protein